MQDPQSDQPRSHRPPLPDGFLWHPVHLLSLGFGTGCARKAPGTVGTLVGVVLYLILSGLPLVWYGAIVASLFTAGVALCHHTAKVLGVHDDQRIVWDEVVGYLITMIAAPAGWFWVVSGFVLFRIFDIFKPWPIRVIDRQVGGGLGIMLDDVLAGVFACGILHLLVYYIS